MFFARRRKLFENSAEKGKRDWDVDICQIQTNIQLVSKKSDKIEIRLAASQYIAVRNTVEYYDYRLRHILN